MKLFEAMKEVASEYWSIVKTELKTDLKPPLKKFFSNVKEVVLTSVLTLWVVLPLVTGILCFVFPVFDPIIRLAAFATGATLTVLWGKYWMDVFEKTKWFVEEEN